MTEPAEPAAGAGAAGAGPTAGAGAAAGAGGARRTVCPSCGHAVGADDNFCEACRTELSPAAVSDDATPAATSCPFCHSGQITPDGYCESCGRKVPSGRDHIELDLGLLAGVTDKGLRHPRNEDAMALATAELASGPAALAVVCDGVSSSRRPDEASLAAVQAAVRVLLAGARAGDDLAETSRAALAAAQEAVVGLNEPGGAPDSDPPSATFVSAVMTGDAVTLCWLGDSRAYWLGAGPDPVAKRLTTDDSVAGEMVAAGLLSEEDALALPQAHVVTGWVGADAAGTAPHVATFSPPGRGALLLCSDGLWNYQPEAGKLAELALPGALSDPQGTAAALVKFALDAGGVDNVTVVLAPFPPGSAAPPAGDATPPAGPATPTAGPAASSDPEEGPADEH
jgi:serine/threonine protein phosphatase PrpC